MAPKKVLTQDNVGPKVTSYGRAPWGDIETNDESGWRDLDEERVEAIMKVIEDGSISKNVLRMPQLWGFQGKPKQSTNGTFLIADGRQMVVAWTRVIAKYEKIEQDLETGALLEEDQTIAWTNEVVDIIKNGFSTWDMAEFEDDDRDTMIAWQVFTHDESNNKFKQTGVADLVRAAERIRKKVPGGSWTATQEKLIKMYGTGRKAFAYRMVNTAMATPEEVLKIMSVCKLIPTTYITENPYRLLAIQKTTKAREQRGPEGLEAPAAMCGDAAHNELNAPIVFSSTL